MDTLMNLNNLNAEQFLNLLPTELRADINEMAQVDGKAIIRELKYVLSSHAYRRDTLHIKGETINWYIKTQFNYQQFQNWTEDDWTDSDSDDEDWSDDE